MHCRNKKIGILYVIDHFTSSTEIVQKYIQGMYLNITVYCLYNIMIMNNSWIWIMFVVLISIFMRDFVHKWYCSNIMYDIRNIVDMIFNLICHDCDDFFFYGLRMKKYTRTLYARTAIKVFKRIKPHLHTVGPKCVILYFTRPLLAFFLMLCAYLRSGFIRW